MKFERIDIGDESETKKGKEIYMVIKYSSLISGRVRSDVKIEIASSCTRVLISTT